MAICINTEYIESIENIEGGYRYTMGSGEKKDVFKGDNILLFNGYFDNAEDIEKFLRENIKRLQ